ncbi:phage portal protein [Actinopolyspora erythraea]|uniref:Phage portal protein n=1 Tax=Actinopolyspora erythraea TaxID=414996 RepID=A0A223RRI7_9ACTN|nr:phage portal protein [Actinopolyspora erythraea]ASU78495.1 phage portal protein [Actinopolyspora erythraea]
MNREETETVYELKNEIESNKSCFKRNAAYFEGSQRLAAMGLAVPKDLQQLQTVVNWCGTYLGAINGRQKIEDFRLAGEAGAVDRLRDWWQANNLDEESDLAHLEALVQGRCYITVGYDEDDPATPVFTVESPESMYARINPRTRKVESALKIYERNENSEPKSIALYFPNETVYAEYGGSPNGWRETDRVQHNLGVVPVVPMVNRTRINDRDGTTEMRDVMGLTDAACRTLTNLQGAQELMALPQRYVLGATEDILQDANGEAIPSWQAYIANILTIPSDPDSGDVSVGQFSAADLRNFTEVIRTYETLVCSVTGLPTHYLGLSTENPASADAIRSSEGRLVKIVERKNSAFESAWEQAMRIGIMLVDGELDARFRRLETVWRNPATPTMSEKADAVRKLAGTNEPLIDRQSALEMMGMSPEEVQKIMDRMGNDPLNNLLSMVGENGSGGVQQSSKEDIG